MTDKPIYDQLAEIGASKPEAWETPAMVTIAMRTVECGLLHAAIDALEHITTSETFYKDPRGDTAGPSIDALRAALAAPKAEPVAWRLRIGNSDAWSFTDTESNADFWGRQSGLRYVKEPLYAATPAAVPLTHMQIVRLWGHRSDGPSNQEIVSFAREVERAHGIAAAGDKP